MIVFRCPKCGGPYYGAIITDGETIGEVECHCRTDGSHLGPYDDAGNFNPGRSRLPACGWTGPYDFGEER